MGCDHVGPNEVIAMAEKHLGGAGVAVESWEGAVVDYKENKDYWGAKSFHTRVVRQGGEWVTTKIDRLPEALPEEELGFHCTLPD